MTNHRSNRVRLMLVLAVAATIAAACGTSDPASPSTTESQPTTSQPPPTQPGTTQPGTTQPTVVTTAGPGIGAATILAVIELTGGCQMMGPNCPTYVLWNDGRAAVVRGRPEVDPFGQRLPDEIVEDLGFIDASLAADLADAIASTDFVAMVDRLGPGVCNACVDGIDTIVSVATPSGIVTLASADVGFSSAEPFFAALDGAVVALQQELPLTLQSR